jgi:hypothetical protein
MLYASGKSAVSQTDPAQEVKGRWHARQNRLLDMPFGLKINLLHV